MNNFIIKKKFPTNKQFNCLIESVGWGSKEDVYINLNRKHSIFSVCVFDKTKIIGMARMVGDGVFYTIYDVAVLQSYQGKGIGTILLSEMMNYFKSLPNKQARLYLGASLGKEKFYEKFGFKQRPNQEEEIGAGMFYLNEWNY